MEQTSLVEMDRIQELISLGRQAKALMESDYWEFLNERIFKALEREALRKLKSSKTDLERLEAQQMLLASEKPRLLMETMIQEANSAIQMLESSQSPKEATYE